MTFQIVDKNIIQKDENTFLVKSRTDPKRWYIVFKSNSKGLICDCYNFSIHQGKKQRCHHLKTIDKLMEKQIIE